MDGVDREPSEEIVDAGPGIAAHDEDVEQPHRGQDDHGFAQAGIASEAMR